MTGKILWLVGLDWRRTTKRMFTAVLAGLVLSCHQTGASALELSLPLKCDLNKTCFIQNYVDIDVSAARRDYVCGKATYDGHKGTDFRLISTPETHKNVAVFAAAPGKVKSVRDGMADRLVNKTNARSIVGRECGNGVVIDHGDGWETQYCHLKRGSVVVSKGGKIARGEKLGEIGFSGRAQFAHVHIEVRHNARVIDPFTAEGVDDRCDLAAARKVAGLWLPEVAAALHYRTGQIIEVGFSGVVPKRPQAETGLAALPKPTANSKALLFLVRGINFRAGDRLQILVTGPGGFSLKKTKELPRAKATAAFYIGRALKDKPRWVAGRYSAKVIVLRDGLPIDERHQDVVID